jgi:hypothetical protein
MKAKKTTRVFRFNVPVGTEKVMVRQFIRDVDGTDHPHDKEIEVPKYEERTAEYLAGVSYDVTEQFALSQQPSGTIAIETRDRVEIVDD